ncbi:MAG TPA: class I SAM-dependent methyltransferase [Trebonia sp.]|nr:class I SAM-dependent methyltransferase [Trebonia sp.]
MSSAKPAVRSSATEGASTSRGDSRKEDNPALAYSRTEAPAASECAWCGHPFDAGDDHRNGRIRCSRCGVATTSPWPSDAQLGGAYAPWYRPAEGRFSGIGDKVLKRTRSTLAKRLQRVLPAGPILDVGAGDGTLIAAFKAHGRDAVGVDPYAAANHPHVRAVEFEDMTGEWSAVVFWHSLEHLRRPVRSLRHAAKVVVPGGVMIVAVPNATSVQARLFGDRWLHLDLPRHLVHISPQALVSQVESLGFDVEKVSYLRGGQVLFGWLHGLVALLPGHPSLYDAIRRTEAREEAQSSGFRLYTLAAGVAALPAALVGTAIEVAARSGGTIYVEARRKQDSAS